MNFEEENTNNQQEKEKENTNNQQEQINQNIENLSKPFCKCGSNYGSHTRTNYSECILNKSKIHLLSKEKIAELNKSYQEKIKRRDQLNYIYNKDHHDFIRNDRDVINKENIINENIQFLNIGRKENFKTEDVFGEYIQNEKSKPNYGRHIMPPRHLICEYCKALVWIEERVYI